MRLQYAPSVFLLILFLLGSFLLSLLFLFLFFFLFIFCSRICISFFLFSSAYFCALECWIFLAAQCLQRERSSVCQNDSVSFLRQCFHIGVRISEVEKICITSFLEIFYPVFERRLIFCLEKGEGIFSSVAIFFAFSQRSRLERRCGYCKLSIDYS